MHEGNLKDAIFISIFDDEDMYRRHYVPTVKHLRRHPEDQSRVKEIVDNATMKYCKSNNLDYKMIPQEVKEELFSDLYGEIIDNEISGSSNEN